MRLRRAPLKLICEREPKRFTSVSGWNLHGITRRLITAGKGATPQNLNKILLRPLSAGHACDEEQNQNTSRRELFPHANDRNRGAYRFVSGAFCAALLVPGLAPCATRNVTTVWYFSA
jgi:hypothetical protein